MFSLFCRFDDVVVSKGEVFGFVQGNPSFRSLQSIQEGRERSFWKHCHACVRKFSKKY